MSSFLYTNSSGLDTVRAAFAINSHSINEIFIASPFFSYGSMVRTLAAEGTSIRLIVRLGPCTSPGALQDIIGHTNVQVRYFTSPLFHCKLYIFGDKSALVGSANMTEAGFQSNREICVQILRESECFDLLVSLYQSYWDQAEVLTVERLNKFARIYHRYNDASVDSSLESEIIRRFGDVSPSDGVQVGRKKVKKDKIFLESYQRTYQEFLAAYKAVEKVYIAYDRRQQELVPLRIEIDQFFSFIRKRYAIGESYLEQPIRIDSEFEYFLKDKLDAWFGQKWPYLQTSIPESYRRINDCLFDPENIRSADIETLFDAINVCHAFRERYRFYPGGHATLKRQFLMDNTVDQVRKVLIYLLHSGGDFVVRMANCIFDAEYNLRHVGRSVVQELLGWVNNENIPICNGRTVKVLRFLGKDVAVYS